MQRIAQRNLATSPQLFRVGGGVSGSRVHGGSFSSFSIGSHVPPSRLSAKANQGPENGCLANAIDLAWCKWAS